MEEQKEPLDFYSVSCDYVKFLYDGEEKHRGFSRLPVVDYGPGRKDKFMCGIVLEIGGHRYLAPVSSYRKQQPNNVLLYNKKGMVTSSVRLNYMFPVIDGVFRLIEIKKIQDVPYRLLLNQEYDSVNLQAATIRRLALSTYQTVVGMTECGKAVNWACDFRYLETLSKEFGKPV